MEWREMSSLEEVMTYLWKAGISCAEEVMSEKAEQWKMNGSKWWNEGIKEAIPKDEKVYLGLLQTGWKATKENKKSKYYMK